MVWFYEGGTIGAFRFAGKKRLSRNRVRGDRGVNDIRNSQGVRPALHPLSGTALVRWRGCGADQAIARKVSGSTPTQRCAVIQR
jgi:hypothetical protein